MLIKAELKKVPSCECPTFSKKELKEVQYIAAAKVVEVDRCGEILVVDYYSSKDKKLQVRFFSDGKNYISYITDEDKWSKVTIANLINGECKSIETHRKLAARFLGLSDYVGKYSVWIGNKSVEGMKAVCSRFIANISQEQSRKASNRKYEKMQSHFSMFSKSYNGKLDSFCEAKVFNTSYIFFSNLDEKRKRKAVCTHCGKHFTLSADIKHKQVGECPKCKHKIRYYAVRYHKSVKDTSTVCYLSKVDNQLLADFLTVTRTSDNLGGLKYEYEPFARTLYLNEKGEEKIYSYGLRSIPWYGYVWCDWGKRPVYREAFTYTENLNDIFGQKYYNVDLKAVITAEKHPFDFIKLLDNLKENPCCEYLCKIGLTKLASQLEIGDYNPRGKSFSEVLGITSQYIPMYRDMAITAKEHRAVRNADVFVTHEWIEKYRDIGAKLGDYFDITEMLEKMSLNKFYKYLISQKAIHCETNLNQIATWFRDYIRMSEQLDVKLDKRNLYPADIKKAHDTIQKRLYEVQKTMKDIASKAALELANNFFKGYEKDGFTVLMPHDRQDFIREGQELSHCVGQERYYKNHISGEKMIFFIRKADKPGKAYFTAEINMVTFSVIQLYGYGDCLPPANVRKFTREFALWLKSETKKLRKAS